MEYHSGGRSSLRSILAPVVPLSVSVVIIAALIFAAGELIRTPPTDRIASRMALSLRYTPVAVTRVVAFILTMTAGIPEIAAGAAVFVVTVPQAARKVPWSNVKTALPVAFPMCLTLLPLFVRRPWPDNLTGHGKIMCLWRNNILE